MGLSLLIVMNGGTTQAWNCQQDSIAWSSASEPESVRGGTPSPSSSHLEFVIRVHSWLPTASLRLRTCLKMRNEAMFTRGDEVEFLSSRYRSKLPRLFRWFHSPELSGAGA